MQTEASQAPNTNVYFLGVSKSLALCKVAKLMDTFCKCIYSFVGLFPIQIFRKIVTQNI